MKHFKQVNTALKQSLAIFLLSVVFLFTGCNQNSDQREFERAAFSMPDGFTQTNPSGEVINRDPDDWRIAPFFQGIVEVDPVYPNPVQSNEVISIDLLVTGVESVSGLLIVAFYGPNNAPLIYDDLRPLPTGLEIIRLEALRIAEFQEEPQGLYRIVIMDANENVITYGDVKVE